MAWTQLGEVLRKSALNAAKEQTCYDAHIDDIISLRNGGWDIDMIGTIAHKPKRLRVHISSLSDDASSENIVCSVLD